MIPGHTRYCKTMGRFFLMLWLDIIQFSRITSDVITGMSVTFKVLGVGNIATMDTIINQTNWEGGKGGNPNLPSGQRP